jgi:hypothetical protein
VALHACAMLRSFVEISPLRAWRAALANQRSTREPERRQRPPSQTARWLEKAKQQRKCEHLRNLNQPSAGKGTFVRRRGGFGVRSRGDTYFICLRQISARPPQSVELSVRVMVATPIAYLS